MGWLDRWIERIRPDVDEVSEDTGTRRAMARSEEIHSLVKRQEPEVRHHHSFARRVIRENDLAPKIKRAVREAH